MKLSEHLTNFKDTFFGIIKDISNYFFIRKVIRKNRNTDEWRKLNLRHDYIYRIYTVVNLRPEDLGEIEEIQMHRFLEKLEPISDYLTDLNLAEIVVPIRMKIPNSLSILLKIVPRTEYITLNRSISFLFKTGGLILLFSLLYKYIRIEYMWQQLIDYLTNAKILR